MSITDVSTANRVLRRTSWKRGLAANGAAVVSLTDFRIDGFHNLLRVVRLGLRVQRSWSEREGSLGLALWVHPLRGRLGSLSAWESEDDLRRWLSSPEHEAAVHSIEDT